MGRIPSRPAWPIPPAGAGGWLPVHVQPTERRDDATDSDLVFFEGDPGVNVGTTNVVVNLESGSLRPALMPGSFSSNLPSLGRCLRRLQPDEQRCRAKVLCR